MGRQVVCVVNFPPKVGPFVSKVLVMGAYTKPHEVGGGPPTPRRACPPGLQGRPPLSSVFPLTMSGQR